MSKKRSHLIDGRTGGRRSGDSYISTVMSLPISLEEKKVLIQKYAEMVKASIEMQLDFYMAKTGERL